jgi:hypothetical protein
MGDVGNPLTERQLASLRGRVDALPNAAHSLRPRTARELPCARRRRPGAPLRGEHGRDHARCHSGARSSSSSHCSDEPGSAKRGRRHQLRRKAAARQLHRAQPGAPGAPKRRRRSACVRFARLCSGRQGGGTRRLPLPCVPISRPSPSREAKEALKERRDGLRAPSNPRDVWCGLLGKPRSSRRESTSLSSLRRGSNSAA